MIVSAESASQLIAGKSPFIVFEGINGGGKSTLIRSISGYLAQKGIPHLTTFEPGATIAGSAIRKVVLGQAGEDNKIPEVAELMLFCADRAIHVEKVIRPALQKGEIVLCDRYTYSTLAFQGYGRGMSLELIENLNTLATKGLTPDLVIILDLDVETSLTRTASRNEGGDSFEDEHRSFHEKLRDGFLKMANERPEPFLILDARQSTEQVYTYAIKAICSVAQ